MGRDEDDQVRLPLRVLGRAEERSEDRKVHEKRDSALGPIHLAQRESTDHHRLTVVEQEARLADLLEEREPDIGNIRLDSRPL